MNYERNESDNAEKCKVDNSLKMQCMYIFLNSFKWRGGSYLSEKIKENIVSLPTGITKFFHKLYYLGIVKQSRKRSLTVWIETYKDRLRYEMQERKGGVFLQQKTYQIKCTSVSTRQQMCTKQPGLFQSRGNMKKMTKPLPLYHSK